MHYKILGIKKILPISWRWVQVNLKFLLDNAAVLYDKGKINGLLIIAPKGVYKNWYDSEIPTHLPDHIFKKTVLWKTSDKSQKQKDFKYFV